HRLTNGKIEIEVKILCAQVMPLMSRTPTPNSGRGGSVGGSGHHVRGGRTYGRASAGCICKRPHGRLHAGDRRLAGGRAVSPFPHDRRGKRLSRSRRGPPAEALPA